MVMHADPDVDVTVAVYGNGRTVMGCVLRCNGWKQPVRPIGLIGFEIVTTDHALIRFAIGIEDINIFAMIRK